MNYCHTFASKSASKSFLLHQLLKTTRTVTIARSFGVRNRQKEFGLIYFLFIPMLKFPEKV